MSETTIAWTEHTWNPVRGCSRISPGCVNCYAERMAGRQLPGMRFTDGTALAVIKSDGPHWTGRVELIPHMLDVPLRRRKPTTYFVNSMSDLFHEGLSNEDIRRVFQVICECRGRHTFQILTKRAARLPEWFAWAKTVEPGWFNERGILDLWQTWLGVSAEDQQRKSRIEMLRETPAAVRFLSLEPLLEDLGTLDLRGIGWCIAGGESGPGARPCDVAWIRSIVQQCKAAGVPVFVKQLGAHVIQGGGRRFKKDPKGGDMSEWEHDLRVREMPA
jgi:protein gp37